MRDSIRTPFRTNAALTTALLLGATLVAGAARAEPAGSRMCMAPTAPISIAAPGAAPGLRIPIQLSGGQRAYIDPVTRELIAPPDAEKRILEVPLEELEAFSFSSVGLERFRTAEGARGIRLGGRFQVAEFATLGANGKAVVTHAWAIVPPAEPRAAEVKP